jgi:hypothetical protein
MTDRCVAPTASAVAPLRWVTVTARPSGYQRSVNHTVAGFSPRSVAGLRGTAGKRSVTRCFTWSPQVVGTGVDPVTSLSGVRILPVVARTEVAARWSRATLSALAQHRRYIVR